ncbi:IS701 family transposase, partial [Aquabacterium sp. A7-Y]|uniref:IS701 family transposase n=1 Tax=Aquabacterium sp. A7-Y TaxID=1349605 RepID=UPI00223DEFFC
MEATEVQAVPPQVQHEVARWEAHLQQVSEAIGARFARSEARTHAAAYLRGLLGPVQRKNGWQLAEAAGDATPGAIQHLLSRSVWDADAVRDDLCDYVVKHLGQRQAVLVVDETGFLKKGRHSAGVQRQYSGTAGRIENCQIGVFLAYVSEQGHAFIDRELYLPKSWTDDPDRCRKAGVPPERAFAAKPQIAQRMLQRALQAGLPFGWVAGDEVYGNDRSLRVWLEQNQRPYVMAIASNSYVMRESTRNQHAATASQDIRASQWRRLSAGDGAKGPRLYDWAWLPLLSWGTTMQRGLLVRRSLGEAAELAYYAVYAPFHTPLQVLAHVAGRRWAIEESFENSKQLVGLDQYEVRSWTGWYRHITLALLAHACLSV